MSRTTSNNVTVSVPAFSLLALILTICKIGGVAPIVNWSWWLVLSPLWAPPAIVLTVWLVFMFFVLLGVVVAAIFGGKNNRRRF